MSIVYGSCFGGRKIHKGVGEEHYYDDAFKAEVWRTHCGNQMQEVNIDRPLPSKVDDFCKTCFRSEAWDTFVAAAQGIRHLRKVV